MALTRNDLQLIREIVQPEFDRIHNKLKEHDEKFAQIDKRFEAIDRRFEAIDKRFEAIDRKFEAIDRRFEEQNESMIKGFKNIISEVYIDFHKDEERLNDHEERITELEVNYH